MARVKKLYVFGNFLSFWVEQFPKISRWRIFMRDYNPRELKTGNVLIFFPILSPPICYLCIAEFYLEKEGNAFYLFHTITWNFRLTLNKIARKLKVFLVPMGENCPMHDILWRPFEVVELKGPSCLNFKILT